VLWKLNWNADIAPPKKQTGKSKAQKS
jgi:hypothetical protein